MSEQEVQAETMKDWQAQRIEDMKIFKKEEERLYADLAEPFPPEMERSVTKSGTALTYIPVSEVITRLNRVFGTRGWSSEIIRCERDQIDPEFIVAHVRLTIESGGSFMSTRVVKDGFGGQKIKRKKDGTIVDLGDEFKGAISDALKKAAQQLGIGLYLARDPDAIEVDEARHAEVQPNPVVEKYEKFKEIRSTLNESQVQELRSYWASWSGGRPIPKPSEFTVRELEALTVEALRISFNGTVEPSFDDE